MAIETISGLPCSFVAGDSVSFTIGDSDFAPATYTATLRISQGSETPISVVGTTSGTSFLFTISPAVSAAILPGDWIATITATSGTDRGILAQEIIAVIENPAVAHSLTSAETRLAALRVAIAAIEANPAVSTSFNGQSATFRDLNSLRDQEIRLAADVIRERATADNRAGRGVSRNIHTRFISCSKP